MRIICFGDSNTYGYDPRGYFGGRYEPEDRWVDLLAKRSGWVFLNAGENGRQIPKRLPSVEMAADIFLIILGTNDLLQGATPEETARRMEAFLEQLMPHYKSILLIVPPPLRRGSWVPSDTLVEHSMQLGEHYQALANKLHLPCIDTLSWQIPLAFDGVHFTAEGHHIFAENLYNAILSI